MGIVRYKQGEVPPISEEEKARYRAMAERQRAGIPDPDIDFSDIPKITDFSGFRPFREVTAEIKAKRKAEAKQAAGV